MEHTQSKEELKEYSKKYHQEHEEQENKRRRAYYQSHKEQAKEYQKKYNQDNKDYISERNNKYNQRPEVIEQKKITIKKWREDNKEHILQYQKQYSQDNREKIKRYSKIHNKRPEVIIHNREYLKEYRLNPEFKEQKRGYDRKYSEKNREKINQYHRDNIMQIREQQRKYYKTPRGKLIQLGKNLIKKERLHNIIHSFSYDEWRKKFFKTEGICPRCKEFVGIDMMTLDHNPPISKAPVGFVYTIDDVNPLCHSCNSSKGNKIENKIHKKSIIQTTIKGDF